MRCLLTGAAGFIGSNLAARLLADGHQVIGYDNLSTGQQRFLEGTASHDGFRLVKADILDQAALLEASRGCDMVFHLAANADVRFGPDQPDRDLKQNTIGTFNVLEAARRNGIGRFAFSSTGSVYGDATVFPTPEDAAFPVQTSLYGASKLAGEGLIAAYSEAFGMKVWIFRFVSILGEHYSHGHVFDFCRSLFRDSSTLKVLGDGTQRKSYLYVQDCVRAIVTAVEKARDRVNIFNLGTDEYVEVKDSARIIADELGVTPSLQFTGGERGWVGDSPFILLDCARIRALGWKPELTIEEGVRRTVRYIRSNRWLLDSRA